MIPSGLDRLRSQLEDTDALADAFDRSATGSYRRAAVLALLGEEPGATASAFVDRLRVVVVEKADHLRRHAGQVAFPGGRLEPGESDVAAALREAQEEVGIDPASVEVLGTLPAASVFASGFNVVTVVGWWRHPVPLEVVDAGEVAAVHQVRVADLVDAANRVSYKHPRGHVGPAFRVGDLFVWGLTGYLLSGLLRLAGWARPWDADVAVEIPERFLRGIR